MSAISVSEVSPYILVWLGASTFACMGTTAAKGYYDNEDFVLLAWKLRLRSLPVLCSTLICLIFVSAVFFIGAIGSLNFEASPIFMEVEEMTRYWMDVYTDCSSPILEFPVLPFNLSLEGHLTTGDVACSAVKNHQKTNVNHFMGQIACAGGM
jgi:hypothetical protein